MKYILTLLTLATLGFTSAYAEKIGQYACPENTLLTQNLSTGGYNGRYHAYTKGTVTEAHLLQGHLNRLGFSAGIEDGKLGKNSDAAIKRMQRSFGLTQIDGKVGPNTRAKINNSCSKYTSGDDVSGMSLNFDNQEEGFISEEFVNELKKQIADIESDTSNPVDLDGLLEFAEGLFEEAGESKNDEDSFRDLFKSLADFMMIGSIIDIAQTDIDTFDKEYEKSVEKINDYIKKEENSRNTDGLTKNELKKAQKHTIELLSLTKDFRYGDISAGDFIEKTNEVQNEVLESIGTESSKHVRERRMPQ